MSQILESELKNLLQSGRPLLLKDITHLLLQLNLEQDERVRFIEILNQTKKKFDLIDISEERDRFTLDESYYKIISEWEHFALLELFFVKGFECNLLEVSRRLNISGKRAFEVIDNLLSANLIYEDAAGNFHRTHKSVQTTSEVASEAIKLSHHETLTMAREKLEAISHEDRDYTAMTLSLSRERLPEARALIKEFRQKLVAIMNDGNQTDVYKMAIQLFPLTEVEKKQ